jgi:hypothetical protein
MPATWDDGDRRELLPFAIGTVTILLGCIVGFATTSVDLATLVLVPGVAIAIALYSERVRCRLCRRLVRRTNVNRCPRCRAMLPQ